MLLAPDAAPEILDSVLDKPAVLSGVPAEIYAKAKDARQQQLFAPQIAELEELETVVSEVDAIAQIARNDLRSVIQIGEREFNLLIDKAPSPWLVKHTDGRIIRVRPERVGTGELNMPATEEEIRLGKFYANEAEYLADRAA
jgi:hypothetical protein